MAQVVQRPVTSERIDAWLNSLFLEWQSIPALVVEWTEWNDVDRLHFEVDWPVKEDSLATLRGWADQGLLDRDQAARFCELLALIERHRPILERLLAE
jgi:hypothetical protein